jgi:3-hydroxyisobutyrate dehydrogenase-like beta-hydroxyacid dehydrogenase
MQGKVWIDHTTTDFEQNFEFEKALAEKGAFLLEAPITGGLDALRKGQMAVWVAGNKDAYEQVHKWKTSRFNLNELCVCFSARRFWMPATAP